MHLRVSQSSDVLKLNKEEMKLKLERERASERLGLFDLILKKNHNFIFNFKSFFFFGFFG